MIAEINTEVLYQMSHHHVPEAARGVRRDDPALGIDWPSAPERARAALSTVRRPSGIR